MRFLNSKWPQRIQLPRWRCPLGSAFAREPVFPVPPVASSRMNGLISTPPVSTGQRVLRAFTVISCDLWGGLCSGFATRQERSSVPGQLPGAVVNAGHLVGPPDHDDRGWREDQRGAVRARSPAVADGVSPQQLAVQNFQLLPIRRVAQSPSGRATLAQGVTRPRLGGADSVRKSKEKCYDGACCMERFASK